MIDECVKSILLVGASSSIGKAIAVEAFRRGHYVVGTSRSGADGTYSMNVCDDASVATVVERLSGENIDQVIYTPAITDSSLIHGADTETWRQVYEVNVLGAVRVARAILPHMMKRRDGTLMFASSTAADRGIVGAGAYSCSKAALNSLARNIAKEYGRFNVRAFTVMPGYVSGGMLKDLDPVRSDALASKVALKRFATTGEIACFVLDSLNHPYLNGSSLAIDGGIDA